jgi:hypothetical protein
MNMMEEYVLVSRAKQAGLNNQPSTFYAWYHKGKNLEIFRKVGRNLFIHVPSYRALFEQGRGDLVKGVNRGSRCSRGREGGAR